MPYLSISTNQAVDGARQEQLLAKASALVARELNKPEGYVMTRFAPVGPMTFGGDSRVCACLELKSIGLSGTQARSVSAALCALLQNDLAIPPDRVYIEFADAKASMWGWNGATF